MTNLKIGTVLIAKEDAFMSVTNIQCLTKDKPYKVKKLTARDFTIESDIDEYHAWAISELDNHFIIAQPTTEVKRYTLTDLKDKKIAVKLRNYEEYKRLCLAVGDDSIDEFYFVSDEIYYGVQQDFFIQLTSNELEGRILLESIDDIDLEEKEEVKEVTMENFIEPIAVKAGDKRVLVNGLVSPVDFRIISEDNYQLLISEITRLNGENEELETALRVTTKKLGDATSQDLTKRERMAWELWLGGGYTVEQAIEKVNYFLENSKSSNNYLKQPE